MSSVAKKISELKFRYLSSEFRVIVPVILFILVCGIVAVSFTFCGKTEVNLRTLTPKDTVIYLETNDLGKALNALTENDFFKENSQSKLDFSVIDGFQVAIAVTGFETSENQVTNEQAVLNFKPKFTAIAETHAWSWQISSLVENNLDNFVKKTYGNDVKLEQKSVNNTERYTWTASDGRKTIAVISGTQVFFGNDEESINKCLLAKRGEVENLLKNKNLSLEYEKAKDKLAFGFISNEGIKQIADLVGVSVAVGQSEDENARGFISRILPQILNNATKEIIWTAEKNDKGIEDRIFIKTKKEVSNVLNETLISTNKNFEEIYKYIPSYTSSVTRYSLKNPQIAFRSLLLVTAENTDEAGRKIIGIVANSLLSPYGIADAEAFLSSVESELVTAQFDEDGDQSIAIVKVKDLEKIKSSFDEELKRVSENTEEDKPEIWKTETEDQEIALINDILILGDSKSVAKAIQASKPKVSPIDPNKDLTKTSLFRGLLKTKAVSATYAKNTETAEKIIKIIGKPKDKNSKTTKTLTETYFRKNGVERKYMSDFGFIGTIIEQFDN